ncbi:hypothetical protein CC80DRAFT_28391 [Byssothecium circinans]|uniref:Uncharacterized protein n=1 Tax=Byssothecium circinans TaxID=147558 RepID=A0A6A5U083_9PLEO|nr:hypothetical protein CC80DRAFT_28391 [Byssothecium circinans]
MSTPTLESLPLIALELVCEYLAHSDFHRRDLFSFSLVSKACCGAADRQRWKRILLAVDGTEKLEKDVQKWEDMLGEDGKRHVRQLKVLGCLPLNRERDEAESAIYWRKYFKGMKGNPDGVGDIYGQAELKWQRSDSDVFLEPSTPNWPLYHLDLRRNRVDKTRKDLAWMVLSKFLTTLPGLKDFVWSSTDQIPHCILTALNTTRTKLHMHTFSIRSLDQYEKLPVEVDTHESSIATFPRLTHVSTKSNNHLTQEHDFNEEAVLQMIAGAAPNLIDVCMTSLFSDGPERSCCLPQASTGFPGIVQNRPQAYSDSKGHLKSLELFRTEAICPDCLRKWSDRTHLEELERLYINVDFDTLEALAQMARNGEFKALQRLCLQVGWFGEGDGHEPLKLLLTALNPLVDLQVRSAHSGLGNNILQAILQCHGSSLKRLFIPYFTPSHDQIAELARSCPSLQQLEFGVQRTGGDYAEFHTYRLLGRIPRLQDVWMRMNCGAPSNTVYSHTEIYNDDERLHFIRLAFINSAVDANLARDIFHIIAESQSSVGSSTDVTLNCLEIRTVRAGSIGAEMVYKDFWQVTRALGRSWVCTRDPRDTYSDKLHCLETDKIQEYHELLDKPLEDLPLGRLYVQAWKEIWPESTGHWVDDWHSFPLKR